MVINPLVAVYIPIIRIPIKGGMTIPNIATFDHGTPASKSQKLPTSSMPHCARNDLLKDDVPFSRMCTGYAGYMDLSVTSLSAH